MTDAILTRLMNTDSIGRALDHHKATGAITDWSTDGDGRWRVQLAKRSAYDLVVARSKREIGLLLAGLASASINAEEKARLS
jgi:hypothetical protein